jgi:D-arabinose 1-dehydrogenase-like Zn-dependent alcohol dehydrogenase
MKAVRIIGYEQAVYTDVPVPVPAADELLVQVRRVGVCHSDVEVFRQELGISPLRSGMNGPAMWCRSAQKCRVLRPANA